MRVTWSLLAAVAATGIAGLTQPVAAAPTTPERLLNAANEPQNWLMSNQSYSMLRNSKLGVINRSNVANLKVKFMAAIGGNATSSVPRSNGNEMSVPLVEDGFLYVTDSHNKIMKFDVRSGERAIPLWRFDPKTEKIGNPRGIALYGNNVFQSTADARLIAINKDSGEVAWEVSGIEPPDAKYGLKPAPDRKFVGGPVLLKTAAGKDLILQGSGGSGVGWFGGFDATNGKNLWRTYTIPMPGEKGHETWADDHEAWRSGRVQPWHIPSFDPETNTAFWGTGEPSPVYDPEYRPGDNLYSGSTVALNVDTGAIKWFYQEAPNQGWDYDSIGSRMIFPFTTADGTVRRAVHTWARTGFFYSMDLVTGQFLQAIAQQDNINWTAGIDPKTGKPLDYVPKQQVQTYKTAGPTRGRAEKDAPKVCATWGGAPTYWPPSYDIATGITYQTSTEGCTYQTILRPVGPDNFNPNLPENLGGTIRQVQVDTAANLIAIDVRAGKVVNRYVRHQGIPGDRQAEVGTLLTAGGLVFTGWADGTFAAYDKDTLAELWAFSTGTNLKAAPITYSVNGKQYVALIAGGDNPGTGISALIMPSANVIVFGL